MNELRRQNGRVSRKWAPKRLHPFDITSQLTKRGTRRGGKGRSAGRFSATDQREGNRLMHTAKSKERD